MGSINLPIPWKRLNEAILNDQELKALYDRKAHIISLLSLVVTYEDDGATVSPKHCGDSLLVMAGIDHQIESRTNQITNYYINP